jgi:hypothetical protein
MLRFRSSGVLAGSMLTLGMMSSDEPPEWRSMNASPCGRMWSAM